VALADVLKGIRSLEDLPALTAAWGHEPLWDPVPDGRELTVVVGRAGDFPWYALSGARADQRARALTRRMAARGRLCGALGLDPVSRRLTVAVSLAGSPLLSLALDAPERSALEALGRLSSNGFAGATGYAAHVADALGGEAVGQHFFREFRGTLERMAAGLPGPLPAADRHALALLQLTRVLFLYFVQAKGWLASNPRFLAEAVDRCLAQRRRVHRDLLRPLFFGTLNRPADERSRAALGFGPIPFLNGGLFEPHPLERRLRGTIPNPLWRDAFDQLFERFHFTVAEGERGGIAPDMLGRVFEGVMAPEERRASGTYYTPSALVHQLVGEGLAALVSQRLHCPLADAEQRIADGDDEVRRTARRVRILDPAVGSGAFLLGALERLGSLGPANRRTTAARRRVLRRSLFGVDRNAAAVRLTELRLWLAVIAEDRTERPLGVHPLPNLDCLIRQGDSLFDPAGCGLRAPADRVRTSELAALRREVVTATGHDKRATLRDLARAEAALAEESLATAEGALRESIAQCLGAARGADLFGARRGLDPKGAERLTDLRWELRRIRSLRRALGRESEVPWFDYRVQFADVFADGGFDLVVGNPPWLRAEELPADLRRRLAGRYRWWRSGGSGYANRPDLAVAFLERSLELAAPGGVVAMLVPAKIAAAGYGATTRHALAGGTTLVTIADLTGSPRASFEATVYPLALVVRKAAAPPRHRVRISLGAGPTVPQSSLCGGAPWLLGRQPLRDALAAVQQGHSRLDSVVPCHLGLKTGANRIFLDPPDVEGHLLRWALRGRDLAPFTLRRRTRLLWTHGADGSPLPRLPPRTAAYLAPHLPLLRSRTDYAGGPPWTLFRTRAATAPHRVVWADLARELRAVSLTGLGDTIPLNSCYVALLKTDAEADRLAAWLNSSWLRAAARAGAVPAAGGCGRYTVNTVGALPLPDRVLSDDDLCTLSRSARDGGRVQADIDDIAARYLDLDTAHRTALLASLGQRSENRG
jgi:Eco57I restriction-modification methylase